MDAELDRLVGDGPGGGDAAAPAAVASTTGGTVAARVCVAERPTRKLRPVAVTVRPRIAERLSAEVAVGDRAALVPACRSASAPGRVPRRGRAQTDDQRAAPGRTLGRRPADGG